MVSIRQPFGVRAQGINLGSGDYYCLLDVASKSLSIATFRVTANRDYCQSAQLRLVFHMKFYRLLTLMSPFQNYVPINPKISYPLHQLKPHITTLKGFLQGRMSAVLVFCCVLESPRFLEAQAIQSASTNSCRLLPK